jgi:hypothetical protein
MAGLFCFPLVLDCIMLKVRAMYLRNYIVSILTRFANFKWYSHCSWADTQVCDLLGDVVCRS